MADRRIVVVGAGPAGLRAAAVLAEAGLQPLLIDEAAKPGGQIYRQPPDGAERPGAALYGFDEAKARRLHGLLAILGDSVEYRPDTLVWNCHDGVLDLMGPTGMARVEFARLILATGATDRVLPLPGWTLPGVFTLGGAQVALKAQGVAIGRRVVFAGTGPLMTLVAHQYAKAGATVAGVLDTTRLGTKVAALPRLAALPAQLAKGLIYNLALAARRVPVQHGVAALEILGEARVEAVRWRCAGRVRELPCDAVGLGFGLRSETQLADLAGCAFVFDARQRQWLPQRDADGRTAVPGIYIAGDGAGIRGADAAELAGARAALALLDDLGLPGDGGGRGRLARRLAREAVFRRGIERGFPIPADIASQAPDALMICRCEGVTAGAVRAAVRDLGAVELNRVKAFTRLGMGRCQGRYCALGAAEIVAAARGATLEQAGRLRGQAPIKPIPIA